MAYQKFKERQNVETICISQAPVVPILYDRMGMRKLSISLVLRFL